MGWWGWGLLPAVREVAALPLLEVQQQLGQVAGMRRGGKNSKEW
jgi:hypothetical protein